jgi:hypothetical protein
MRRLLRESLESERFGLRSPEETVPPQNERVSIHATWAIETYTPRHIEQLRAGLEALGLGTEEFRPEQNIRDRLRDVRERPHGGYYLNLKTLAPKGSDGFLGAARADLREAVRAVRSQLWALTPSVTAIAFQFVLTDDAALLFDRLSRRTDFEPEGRLHEGGFSIQPPDNVKKRELDLLRKALRQRGASWIRDNLPGDFSESQDLSLMPTAELVTTELQVPFERGTDWRNYLAFVGFGFTFDRWTSSSLPGWRWVSDREEPAVTLAGKRSVVLENEHLDIYGSEPEWALTAHMNDAIEKNLILWATAQLLSVLQGRLAAVRDQALREHASARSASRRLKRIRRNLLRDSLDARICAEELRAFADRKHEFEWGATRFVFEDFTARSQEVLLLDELRASVRTSAMVVSATESRLREALVADGTMMSAQANLRLQRQLSFMNVLVLLIAVASLVVSIWTASTIDSKDSSNERRETAWLERQF